MCVTFLLYVALTMILLFSLQMRLTPLRATEGRHEYTLTRFVFLSVLIHA
jgi:hypothetical protein